MNMKIIELAYDYARLSCWQGYRAKELGIDINDRKSLAEIPEGRERLSAFEKLVDEVNKLRSEHGD